MHDFYDNDSEIRHWILRVIQTFTRMYNAELYKFIAEQSHKPQITDIRAWTASVTQTSHLGFRDFETNSSAVQCLTTLTLIRKKLFFRSLSRDVGDTNATTTTRKQMPISVPLQRLIQNESHSSWTSWPFQLIWQKVQNDFHLCYMLLYGVWERRGYQIIQQTSGTERLCRKLCCSQLGKHWLSTELKRIDIKHLGVLSATACGEFRWAAPLSLYATLNLCEIMKPIEEAPGFHEFTVC